MFGRSGVIDNPGSPQQCVANSKEPSVGWWDVSFHRGRIGAQLLSGDNGRLVGLLHDPLVDLLSALLAKERESST